MRAYDPTLGRFLSRDPLGRAPLFVGGGNPYVYAGNNPLSNVDPNGLRAAGASAAQVKQAAKWAAKSFIRMMHGSGPGCDIHCKAKYARSDASAAMSAFGDALNALGGLVLIGGGVRFILTKEAFAAMLESVVVKAAVAGLAGIAVPIFLAWVALKWEASQSLAWFEHRTNVDTFFRTVEWGMFVIAAILGVGAAVAGVEAAPVSFVFALSVLIGDGIVTGELDKANHEQDREYSRTTP